MKLDQTTEWLFGDMPREFATPSRKVVRSLEEFCRFIEVNDGIKDIYTSVYSLNGSIDKIFWDIDSSDHSRALRDAQTLYRYLVEQGHTVIPVVSGKKGYHLYLILRDHGYEDAKPLLGQVSYSILAKAFGAKKHCVDPHPIGDIKRICRVPNTLRPPENLNFCTYLPPDGFLDMKRRDIVSHMKSTHVYDYDINGKLPLLTSFELIEGARFNGQEQVSVKLIPNHSSQFLKGVLRPCLYRHMMTGNPSHAVRVSSTIDLIEEGLDPETIFNCYERLSWSDWDAKTTRYQIEHCFRLKPYSCKKLRGLGIPRSCCIE